jgi:hypothetical protein
MFRIAWLSEEHIDGGGTEPPDTNDLYSPGTN